MCTYVSNEFILLVDYERSTKNKYFTQFIYTRNGKKACVPFSLVFGFALVFSLCPKQTQHKFYFVYGIGPLQRYNVSDVIQ